jgi:large subunit ribosomal protein L19
MQNRLMDVVEKSTLKTTVPKFEIGDTVDVHVRILEGDKERIQIFNGFVIARSGAGPREMFVVRRIVQGEGVERKFPLQSPRIADIVVKRSGKVRRAKLYYLRQLSGKAVRLKERFTSTATTAEAKAAKAERKKARAAKKEKANATATGGTCRSAVEYTLPTVDSHTNPKRKLGPQPISSLTLRVSISLRCNVPVWAG